MIGFHHLRARTRLAQGLEPSSSARVWKRLLDYFMYGVGVVAPVALVPQIVQIYTTRSATDISLLTWALITFFNALWAVYGAAHKDKLILFAYTLITIFDLVIVAGILLY